MRQSVILPSTYEHLFLYEAQDSGLIKKIPSYADELYDVNKLKMADESHKNYLRDIPDERQKILQTVLLFDEIILDKADMNYDYQNLVETGFFRTIDFDNSYYYDPMKEDGHIEYSNYLKPAIMPLLIKNLNRYFPLITNNINFNTFVSKFYDLVLTKKKLSNKYQQFIEINKMNFDEIYKNTRWYWRFKSLEAPSFLLDDRYYFDIQSQVMSLYESLCWQLMVSSDYNSAIINSEFQLATIGCESFTDNIESALQVYRILQIECSKLIGTLPEVNNLRTCFQNN